MLRSSVNPTGPTLTQHHVVWSYSLVTVHVYQFEGINVACCLDAGEDSNLIAYVSASMKCKQCLALAIDAEHGMHSSCQPCKSAFCGLQNYVQKKKALR